MGDSQCWPTQAEIADILAREIHGHPLDTLRKPEVYERAADVLLARLREGWEAEPINSARIVEAIEEKVVRGVCLRAAHGDSSPCSACVVCRASTFSADLHALAGALKWVAVTRSIYNKPWCRKM
jgi:hypothetical protein